ncbi:MAG TPA: BON domain-containing protein [Rhodopila sp.]|nr:BON domain-containing protein [Rhodopila sp.]
MNPNLRLRQDAKQVLGSHPAIDTGCSEKVGPDYPAMLTKHEDDMGLVTDVELAQSARAAIERKASAVAGKVRAVVRNGWLILEGEVTAPVHKRVVEEAVRGLNGIRGVSNNILIEGETMSRRVSQKIDEMFTRGARLSAHRIAVTTRDHKVILSGSVRCGAEREEAEAAARAVPGVAEVINRIRTRS